jgi:hypothetical protein
MDLLDNFCEPRIAISYLSITTISTYISHKLHSFMAKVGSPSIGKPVLASSRDTVIGHVRGAGFATTIDSDWCISHACPSRRRVHSSTPPSNQIDIPQTMDHTDALPNQILPSQPAHHNCLCHQRHKNRYNRGRHFPNDEETNNQPPTNEIETKSIILLLSRWSTPQAMTTIITLTTFPHHI